MNYNELTKEYVHGIMVVTQIYGLIYLYTGSRCIQTQNKRKQWIFVEMDVYPNILFVARYKSGPT